MKLACFFGIEAQVELVLPAKLETRFRQSIVANLRTRVTFCQICRMRSQLVGDDPLFHVVLVRQTKVLLRCHVAEHRCAEPPDHRSADTTGDVVVAGSNIGRQRPQGVERCLSARIELQIHVLLDHVHRHVARSLDHHLNVMPPGDLGQLAERLQLAKLGFVVGIVDGAGAQAVAEAESNVVSLHDLADLLEVRVQEAFLVVGQAPLGHDRTTARNDARQTFGRQWHVTQQHAGVNREVVDALLSLLDQGVAENLPRQVFGLPVNLLKRLIDGHGPYRHRAVANDPLARLMDVLAR